MNYKLKTMKKLLLLITLFLGTNSYSQGAFGVSLGANSLFISSDYYKLEKTAMGGQFGLTYKYYLSDNINAMIDVDFFATKLKFDKNVYFYENEDNNEGYSTTLIGMRYTILGNYNFSESIGGLLGAYGEANFSSGDYNPKFNYGLSFGVIGNHENFSVELLYSIGLANITPEDPDYGIDSNDLYEVDTKHNNIHIRFTYYLSEF